MIGGRFHGPSAIHRVKAMNSLGSFSDRRSTRPMTGMVSPFTQRIVVYTSASPISVSVPSRPYHFSLRLRPVGLISLCLPLG